MKAWEIIGWTYDGAMYHDGCEPDVPEQTDTEEGKCPIFASDELGADDYCDHCLHTWIARERKPAEDGHFYGEDSANAGAPSHVYMVERE